MTLKLYVWCKLLSYFLTMLSDLRPSVIATTCRIIAGRMIALMTSLTWCTDAPADTQPLLLLLLAAVDEFVNLCAALCRFCDSRHLYLSKLHVRIQCIRDDCVQ